MYLRAMSASKWNITAIDAQFLMAMMATTNILRTSSALYFAT